MHLKELPMSAPRLSDRLLDQTRDIRARILDHPFVRGIGTGDLPLDGFRFYVRQDYRYLIEYSRVLALGAARARDIALMELFASLTNATLTVEMELHRGFCERLGITRADLEATPIAPTTHAYTNHLLTTAYMSSATELMAALLPCQWGYWEIGRHLAARGLPEHQPLYAEWIMMYAGDDYATLARKLLDTFDRVATNSTTRDIEHIADVFVTSSRYEMAFWEMAYRQEQWPV